MEDGTYRPRPSRDTEKARVISTVVGALVGGLGDNTLERRFEAARERDREQQEAWEEKWGKESRLPRCDTGKGHKYDRSRERLRHRCNGDSKDDLYCDYLYHGRQPGRVRSEE